MSRENLFTSRDIPEKENGKDQSPKPVRVRSPMVGKSSKHFMSPTISAASKIAVSPKKKILGDRNEPVRSSISLSGMKSSSLNPVNQSLEASKALESDANPQVPPVSNSKSSKTVRFGGFEVISDSYGDLKSTYQYNLNPEVVTMAVETDTKSEIALVSKSATVVAPSKSSNSDFEVISISNINLDSPPSKSNFIEEVDCVNLDPSFKISPVSSPIIAPLDADPSIPPYDPKTNYLSPRPQFLHYKPNRRINRYKLEGRLEEKLFSFANVSESEFMEETDSEDSPKESDEASSNGSQMEEEEEEGEINVSEQSPADVKKSSKLCFSRIFKISSLLLILFTVFLSICIVNVHDPNIFKRPSSLTMEDPSEIFEFAKTSFNVLVGKLEVWHGNSISFISDVVFNFRGGPPLIHYHNQSEFFNGDFNMNEQCLASSHQTVWEEENNLNVTEAMKDRENNISEEPIEKECEEEEGELRQEIGVVTVERESENEEQEQEQEDLLLEIETMNMREIIIENAERESQNEEELEEASFQETVANANEEENELKLEEVSFQETEANANEEENEEAFEESLQEIIEEASANSASGEPEEEYIQEKPEESFKVSSSSDFKFHDQIEQAVTTGETEEEKNTEFQYQSPPVSPPCEHQSDFEVENGVKIVDLIGTETGISRDFTQNTAIIISAILLGLSLIIPARLIYARKSGSKLLSSSEAIAEEQEEEQPLVKEKKMNQSQVEEDEEDDMGVEFCPSETSSFQYSSMREGETKAGKRWSEVQSHSHGRKKMRKNSRRESMASSSLDEYSVSTSASPSYGSFTTYEKIPIKHVSISTLVFFFNYFLYHSIKKKKKLT